MEPIHYLIGFTFCLTTSLLVRGKRSLRRYGRQAKCLALLSIIFLLGLLASPAHATTITEYQLLGNPGPLEIAIDSKEPWVWFTGSAVDKIGRLAYQGSDAGKIVEYSVPTPSSYLWGITNVSDYWRDYSVVFTEGAGGKIGALARNGTMIREWRIPSPGSNPRKIIFDKGRNCTWFTEYATGKIGLLNVADDAFGSFQEYTIPTPSSYPFGIALDPLGPTPTLRYVWFSESATGKIGRLDPESGTVVEYVVGGAPWDIAVDPDGFIWFTDATRNVIGRLNPHFSLSSRWELVTFTIPTSNCEPRNIAIDPYGSVWFTEFSDLGNKIAKYTPLRNTFNEWAVQTSNAKPHGLVINQTYGGTTLNVWFTEFGSSKIARLRQPEGPTVTTTVSTISSAATTSITTVITTWGSTVSTSSSANVVGVTTTFASPTTAPLITTSSTVADTLSTLLTSSSQVTATRTTTTSTSWTTTTTTSTQRATSTLTTSTTTTTTGTSVSTSFESVTLLTTSTSLAVSSFFTTTSTTLTQTVTSTTFSPTVTVATTTTSTVGGTVFSPTITATTTTTALTTTSTTESITLTSTTHTPTMTLTTTTTTTTTAGPLAGLPTRPCLIASASYGSELAPEVQALRSFRNDEVLHTVAGTHFMKAFNAFYYSFSPVVAQAVKSSPAFAEAMRLLLYPLLQVLRSSAYTYSSLSFTPELGMIVSGLQAVALVGILYLGPLALLHLGLKRKQLSSRVVKIIG